MTPETQIETLTEQLGNLLNTRDKLESRVSALGTKRDQVKAELIALTSKRDSIQAELGTPLSALTAERDSIRSGVSSLEKRCGLSGIDHEDAIAVPANGSIGHETLEDFEARMKNARNEAERLEILQQFQNACAKGKLKPDMGD
jgi:hypothetical protein